MKNKNDLVSSSDLALCRRLLSRYCHIDCTSVKLFGDFDTVPHLSFVAYGCSREDVLDIRRFCDIFTSKFGVRFVSMESYRLSTSGERECDVVVCPVRHLDDYALILKTFLALEKIFGLQEVRE